MHRLTSRDLTTLTGVCQLCGEVPLYERSNKGKKEYRCSVAVISQRDSPNRSKNWHGVPSAQAIEMKKDAICEICGHTEKLVIDHDHETLEVRGILCGYCNTMLGFARDRMDLLAAGIVYLAKTKCPPLNVQQRALR